MGNVFKPQPSQQVNDFHNASDVDSDSMAQHHTLGRGPNQAAAGNHKHDNTGWVTAIMGNSWVHYDARTVQYKRLSSGLVIGRGLAKNGVVGAGIFTLDVGYRPELRVPNDHHLPIVSNGAFGTIFVDGNGIVTAASGSNVWFDFSGMHFMAAGF